MYTLGFVLALLAAIPLLAGVGLSAQAFFSGGSQRLVGLVLLAVGSLAGIGFWAVVCCVRARAAIPAVEVPPTLIIDLEERVLLDRGGNRLVSLDRVTFGRKLQLGSSSPALAARFAGKTVVVARGNPFAGGLGNLEEVLRRRGLMR